MSLSFGQVDVERYQCAWQGDEFMLGVVDELFEKKGRQIVDTVFVIIFSWFLQVWKKA